MNALKALSCLVLLLAIGAMEYLFFVGHPYVFSGLLLVCLMLLFWVLTTSEERWIIFARLVDALGGPGHPDATMDPEAYRAAEFYRNIRNL